MNRKTKVKVRRTGFSMVPDFASTAHMIQGQSLTAAFVDLVHAELHENITEDLYVAAYVMLSRARFLENLWILRHFGPLLFSAGPPAGPHLLMQKLRGEITPRGVADQLAALTKKEAARQIEAKKRRAGSSVVLKLKL